MSDSRAWMVQCLDCDPPQTTPCESDQARGSWASSHTQATGHDRYRLWEGQQGDALETIHARTRRPAAGIMLRAWRQWRIRRGLRG